MCSGSVWSGRLVLVALLAGSLAVLAGCGSTAPGSARAPDRAAPLPAAAYGHYLRGRMAMIEGDYGGAVAELGAAARVAPDEAPVRVALMEALLRAGHRDQARRVAERAQARWPDHAAIWLASGRVYKAMGVREPGALQRAARAFERARTLAPHDEDAHLGLASVYVALKQPQKAEAVYGELVKKVPGSVQGHYRLARRLMERQKLGGAESHLRQVLDIEPDDMRARVALARVLRATGRKGKSIATLREAFDRSDGDPRVSSALFRQLLEAGERDEAIRLLGLLDRDDLEEDAKIGFGYLYLEIGEYQAGWRLGQAILEQEPASGEARLLVAAALAGMQRRDEAAAVLLEVAPEQAAYPNCRALAGEYLAQNGEIARALEVVEQALALYPHHLDLIMSQARVHELGGQVKRARSLLRTALAARPNQPGLLYGFALFEDRQGHPGRAVALMERILELYPDDAGALNFIGFSLADRNIDLARAERLLERAVELSPGNAFVLDSLGWLRFRQKRLHEARSTLARAVHIYPGEPELIWHLGEVDLALGARTRALGLFEKARDLGPEPRVREQIEARIHALGTHK